MIFNLNEQKVLSDPSGSSVFKGEKDFNDIVVNLPDNIDGHTATELNYVMHFVDSDGGYSTKILTIDSSGETLKATATVSTNITSKAQAFYAYVLMTDDEETVIGKTNGVIVMIHPVPDEENEIIPPADADKIIKGLEEIVKEATETIETATDTIEEATEAISSKQDKLTAGENITISSDNVISAEGGVTSYEDLTDKPTINGNDGNGDYHSIALGNIVFSNEFYLQLLDSTHIWLNSIHGSKIYDLPLSSFTPDLAAGLFHEIPENEAYMISRDLNQWGFAGCEGNICVRIPSPLRFVNLPDYIYTNNLKCVVISLTPDESDYAFQLVLTNDANNNKKTKIFARYKTTKRFYTSHTWQELTGGGSQIVSGVVNANGTITFTDSDGNTFTTIGSSVIGADGFSPIATVTQTASGATVSITDSTGTTTANISNGADGQDYVLTAQDKSDIADIVLSELPTTQGVLYGNTIN